MIAAVKVELSATREKAGNQEDVVKVFRAFRHPTKGFENRVWTSQLALSCASSTNARGIAPGSFTRMCRCRCATGSRIRLLVGAGRARELY